jgi:hypothetical protein
MKQISMIQLSSRLFASDMDVTSVIAGTGNQARNWLGLKNAVLIATFFNHDSVSSLL